MNKHQAGDLFTIPMSDGRWAIGQIICALHERFHKVFSFGVLHIGDEPHLPEGAEACIHLDLEQHGRFPQMMFASSSNLRRQWKVIGHLPLTEQQQALQWFHVGGHLYHHDEWIRILAIEEYKHYPVMSVAGNELVQIRLAQYGTNGLIR